MLPWKTERRGLLAAALLLTLAGAGCDAARTDLGAARVAATCDDVCAAGIARVVATVSAGAGPEFTPISAELPRAGDEWSGNITAIPAGGGRRFEVVATGPTGLELHRASVRCDVAAGAPASVTVVLSGPAGGPIILSVISSRSTVSPGAQADLAVVASDPAGGALAYQWSATCGTFAAADQARTSWTAPAAEGRCQLTVAVAGRGGTAVAHTALLVGTVDRCTSVTCPAPSDACHLAGACNPATGQCAPETARGCPAASDACHLPGTCNPSTGQCAPETAVVCPPASDACHVAGACDQGTGQCRPETPLVCPNPGDACDAGDGLCRPNACVGVTCPPASDRCHLAGSCSPASGQCAPEAAVTCPPASDRCHVAGTCSLADGQCGPEVAVACPSGQACDLADGLCKAPPPAQPAPVLQRADGQLVGEALGLAVDAAGALYRAGSLNQAFDFGSGLVTPAPSPGVPTADLWLGRFDPATGAATWAFGYGDAAEQFVSGLAASSGRLGLVGSFTGTLDLGGGFSAQNPSPDIGLPFLAVLDPAAASGQVRPTATVLKTVNLNGGSFSRIAAHPARSRFAVCGTATAAATAAFGATDLVPGATGGGAKDIVVAVVDETAAGGVAWARQIGGTGDQTCSAVAFDPAGNLLVTGTYGAGVLDFGAGALAPAPAGSNVNVYLARLDGSTGAVLQAAGFGGSPGRATPNAIAVAGNGEVLLAGSVLGRITFGGVTVIGTGTSTTDAFAVKLAPDFTVAAGWPVRIGGPSADAANAAAIDAGGQAWVTGSFSATTTAPGPDGRGAAALTSAGGTDVFLVRLDGAGAVTFAGAWGDAFGQAATTLVSPAAGQVWLGGTFGNSITFGPLPSLGTSGGSDVRNFLVRLQQDAP